MKIAPSNLGRRNAEDRQRERASETVSGGTVIPTFSAVVLTSSTMHWAGDIMNVLVTGGAGFLGQLLIAEILRRTVLSDAQGCVQEIEGIIALDRVPGRLRDARVHYVIGDVTNPLQLSSVFDASVDGIFHLAAVVSGTAEADFALGMRVNLGGTQAILDACRGLPKVPKVLFTSSVAVFGGRLPKVVTDETRTTPQASYGVQKLIGELLVSEYSRKGFVDGRSVRVPTVSVRPGRPNGAVSSFASGIIREPLAGVQAICPVEPDTLLWLTSPGQLIASLLHAYELPAAAWNTERSLNLPGITVKVGDMVEALNRIAGPAVAGLVQWQPDPWVSRIVRSWPANFDTARADAMGFTRDASFASIIQHYIRTCTY
jgi:nucleoside-diphosphate-sugar epimerase